MNFLSDVITYVRRIIKSPSNSSISDNLIIDYINRFYINDVDAEMQVFDLKTKYQFQTSPGVDQYNMPLYSFQSETPGSPGSPDIGMYPVYQGFLSPAYINGVQVQLQTQKTPFFNMFPNIVQNQQVVAVGDGGATYSFQLPILGNTTPVNIPVQAILRGHVDISGIIARGVNQDPPLVSTLDLTIPVTSALASFFITSSDATGKNVVVTDSGQFITNNVNQGLLMSPGNAPFGNTALPGGYLSSFAITGVTQANPAVINSTTTFVIGQSVTITGISGMTELNGNTYEVVGVSPTTVTIDVDSTLFTPYVSGGFLSSASNLVNYLTGDVELTFPVPIPDGVNISAQCYYFQTGLPRAILYYNNTLTLRSPPDRQYLVELDAYLSPAAFFNTSNALQFGYMAEYIARGAARKILLDTGDVDQFNFYEPEFNRQRNLVWKRSQRQWTNNRTETIYSQGSGRYGYGNNNGAVL